MEEMERERTGKKESFFDDLGSIDKKKATKFIVYGILAALLFSVVASISVSIANNAGNWADIQNQENDMNFYNGEYGHSEYVEKQEEIQQIQNWMEFQDVFIVNIAMIGVYLGFFFVFLGFAGFAVNEDLDERTRLISLIIAALIILSIVGHILGSGITITV
ncbi:MAG: hypothetical protein ACOC44_15700 [Promethearchaeia archaeon]